VTVIPTVTRKNFNMYAVRHLVIIVGEHKNVKILLTTVRYFFS